MDEQEVTTAEVEVIKPKKGKELSKDVMVSDTVTPDVLKTMVKIEGEKRAILKEYVQSQLTEGQDYGVIMIKGTASKPTLFKSGMEKILSLLNIQSELVEDEETVRMIGAPGTICYKCLLTRNGQFIGEGRGACSMSEKGNRANDAIKIAEKRARMDACLSLGFSEYFTQDLDDQSTDHPAPTNQPLADRQAARFNQPVAAAAREVFQTEEAKPEVEDIEVFIEAISAPKQSANGNNYYSVKTDQGFMTCFDEEVVNQLVAGQAATVEVKRNNRNGKEFTTITNLGLPF